jgi:predicted nucleic acid-binding protein
MNPDTRRILVDTSAWIAGFRSEGDLSALEFLKQKIAAGEVVTATVIILELVQGCKTRHERDQLRLELASLDILEMDAPAWERACALAFDLRRKGLTIPSMDIMIIALALENDCAILHLDRHFLMAAEHLPNLRVISMTAL